MATTISTDSPKLTANIADHANVYGGRALVFDGVSDYLDCGTELGNQLGNNYSGGLSVSMWINVNSNTSITEKGLFFIGNFGGSYGEFTITQNTNNLMIYLNQNAYQKTFAYTARDTWTHICFVVDSQSESNTKFYIDGEAQSILTNVNNTFPSSGDLDFSGLKTVIGNFFNGNYPFHGKITDTKLFNTALTEAQVQELYKKPENTPSAVQDNLVAWYPMIESNPESPQSIVYDHSEKKLGSDIYGRTNSSLFTAGSGAGQWSGGTVTSSSVAGGATLNGADPTLSTSVIYKVEFTCTVTSGSFDIRVGSTSTGTNSTGFISSSGTYAFNIIAGGSNHDVAIIESSWVGSITSFSIKEVLMGNHATTNFFGDELVEDGGFATATASSTTGAYWTTGSAWDINTTSSGKAYVNNTGGGNNSIYQSSSNGSVSANPLTAGKTYRTTGTAVISSLDAGTYLNVMSGGSNTKTIVPAGSTGTVNFDEEFVADTGTLQYRMVGVGSLTLDDVTVREVGISSSGFETAVNEPVVPQVPLMRYNQKMITSSTASANTYVHLPDGLTAGLTEITISLWFQKIQSGNSRVVLFAVDGGGTYFRDIGNNRITCHMPFDNGQNPFSYFDFPSDLAPHHYVFTVKSGSQEVYRDGILVHSTTKTTTTMSHNIRRIGNYANEQDTSMADEFAIFNKHFTQAEAQELFNDGVALDATTHSKKGNLLGYWRNDGVTTWQDRRGWSALTFDSTDYIDCGTAIGTSLGDSYSNDLTISAWFKLASTGTSRGIFEIGAFTGSHGQINVWYSSVGNLMYRLNGGNWTRSVAFSDLGWNHISIIYDASSESNSKLYLNGSSVGSASGTFPSSLDLDGLKSIIGAIESSSYNWEGDIKSIGLYNVAKSQSEIEAIYNAGINSSEVSNSGIINYWELDNASTVKDLVGSSDGTPSGTLVLNDGNNGTVQGTPDSITIREGLNSNRDGLGFYFKNPSSNVLRLNGVDEYVVAPDTDLSLSEQITIECWAKNNSDDLATDEYFASHYETTSGNYRSWFFRMKPNEALRFVWSSNGTDYSAVETSSSVSNVNTWRHYVVTLASGVPKIYVDGESLTLDSIYNSNGLQTSIYNTIGNIFIGRIAANDNDYHWNGLIDEVKIYNRALSLAEIQKNYKHQKGKHKND
jgi:hypothetical protein